MPNRQIKDVITILTQDSSKRKAKILVADDSEMNRAILWDILEEYEIIEAENGVEAVAMLQKYGEEISLLLLDVVMPEMDGFGVLTVMNQRHWIDNIPVIIISAETTPSYVERAYELGVTDFISRPFDALIVYRRVINTLLLYGKQKKLIGLVEDQIYEKQQRSSVLVDILSHIVEFRNGRKRPPRAACSDPDGNVYEPPDPEKRSVRRILRRCGHDQYGVGPP